MNAITRRHFAAVLAASGTNFAAAAKPLQTLRRVHPRIVVDAAGFDRVRKQVNTEPLPKRWYKAIRGEAEVEVREVDEERGARAASIR